ncbi:DUF2892 domain-containing protein [Georgenia sp. M64]|uniref:YgaP family membrane protein n=1 Tax=Georgenia sp. M64 TaxID=3120520 RepID=UPI0030DE4F58
MKKNMSDTDRKVRAAVAPVLVVAGLLAGPGGALAITLYAVAGILLGTAAVGFCPAYALVGFSTARTTRTAPAR